MRHLLLVSCVLLVLTVTPAAQWPGGGNHSPSPQDIHREMELGKQRSKERYQDIRRDTDKLLSLATELKQQVDAAGEQKLSLDVIKKTEQIEKLAKSVRAKMKGD
jgi:hypothetical protein